MTKKKRITIYLANDILHLAINLYNKKNPDKPFKKVWVFVNEVLNIHNEASEEEWVDLAEIMIRLLNFGKEKFASYSSWDIFDTIYEKLSKYDYFKDKPRRAVLSNSKIFIRALMIWLSRNNLFKAFFNKLKNRNAKLLKTWTI